MTEQLVRLQIIDDNPFQDRGSYEDIPELGRTIALVGLEQTPKARLVEKRYQLKFGHRRKRAFEWLRDNFKTEGLPERYNGYSTMPLEVEEITDKEMFDGVVIENVHRDDLKVTEKARLLRRYKEVNPEATSEQIGVVFNMKGATVRGMDIFLDLPVAVQTKLDDGTISMGTARQLHSMQRIATEKEIINTLKIIEQENGSTLPEEVIEREIDDLDHVLEMWNESHNNGNARAGYHGWPLDMKNLPSRLLPALTYKDVIEALRVDESPRLAAYKKNTLSFYELLEKLKQANEPEAAYIEHLLEPSACTACPFYTKVHGTHFCGMKICHQRKSVAWQDHSVELASKKTKIDIYKTSDGLHRALSYQDEALFKNRHKDLRLIPKRMVDGYAYQSYKELDDDLVLVVATGSALNKLKTSSGSTKGGKKTEKEKAEMRALKIYRMRRKELLWAFTACAKSMFDAVPGSVLERLSKWQYLPVDDAPPVEKPSEDDKVAFGEYLRHLVVWKMILDSSSSFRRETFASILEDLQEFARDWKVKVPTVITKMVEQFDVEIESIVAVETVSPKGKKKKE